MSPHDDCIAAIASAAGGAPRGIIRISGGNSAAVLRRCFVGREFDPDTRRAQAYAGYVRLSELAIELPCRLYYWPTHRSYTGQPAAELHTLGAPPLLEALLDVVRAAGARVARPGEFTLRAFLADRIDLTQAEAVLGVIDARTDAELSAALAQLAGGIARSLRELRGVLLDLLADLEAGLDFVEEDIAFVTGEELLARLADVASEVRRIATQLDDRDVRDALPRVVLVGPPNAGKSSLFNALVGSARAIVADIPGTTRDYLVATLDLDGVRCELCDTAGIDATDPREISRSAQSQRLAAQRSADVELNCRDASHPLKGANVDMTHRERPQIHVWTKSDLAAQAPLHGVATSAMTGAGMGALREAIHAALEQLDNHDGGIRSTAARCHGTLDEARAALERAAHLVETSQGEELVAAEIHAALQALGEVVGAVYTDDLLDRVFSRFCIGK